VISDLPNLCDLAAPDATLPDSLQLLAVVLCPDGPGAVSGLEIRSGPSEHPCPTGAAWAELRSLRSGTPSLVYASGGSVSVVNRSSDRLAGNLDLRFADGSLGGSFTAAFCPDLNDP
jgi:hypothetical protein